MSWFPDACTLPTADQPLRVAEFDEVFAAALSASERARPTVLRLYLPHGEPMLSRLRDLVVRETSCCSVFSFVVKPSADVTVLEAQVPESQVAVLDAMQARAETVRVRGGQA